MSCCGERAGASDPQKGLQVDANAVEVYVGIVKAVKTQFQRNDQMMQGKACVFVSSDCAASMRSLEPNCNGNLVMSL